MLLDQLADPHHKFQVGIVGGDGKDVGSKGIIFSQALFQILEFGKYEEVVCTPVEE